MMLRCLSVLLFFVLLASPQSVLADGIKYKGKVNRFWVVKQSQVILAVRALKVLPRYKTRRAYGRERRYISQHRVFVEIISILRGKAKLRQQAGKLRRLWLETRGDFVPGKWRLVRDHYPSSYHIRRTRQDDRFVVYIGRAYAIGKRTHGYGAYCRYFDSYNAIPSIQKLIPLAQTSQQKMWRKSSICPRMNTWWFRKRCRSLKWIKRKLRCPRRAKLAIKTSNNAPYSVCKKKNGRLHGSYYQWDKSGSLYYKSYYHNGKQRGWSITWHKNGKKASRVRHNRRGQRFGISKRWHPNGKLAVWGRFRKDYPHGKWFNYDDNGKLSRIGCWKRKKQVWSSQDIAKAKRRKCL